MENQETNDKKDKNRRMYISVPNFKFHHATDEFSGFIGRNKIKERLKDLLTGESGNKVSGAYLITGNRGVGKTTFVNKVKSEIEGKSILGLFKTPILVVLGVLLITIINNLPEIPLLHTLCDFIILILVPLTFVNAIYVTYKSLYKNASICKWLAEFFKISFFLKRIKKQGRFVYFIHLLVLVFLITKTSLCIYRCCQINNIHIILAFIYVLFYFAYFAYSSYKTVGRNCKNKQEYSSSINFKKLFKLIRQDIKGFLKYILRKIKDTTYRILCEPKRIFIKINLGHDKLKVIDVLRLIAHYIYVEYRNFLYSGLRYIARLLLIILIAFVITKIISSTGLLNNIMVFINKYNSIIPLNGVVDAYNDLYLIVIGFLIYLWELSSNISTESMLDVVNVYDISSVYFSLSEAVVFFLLLLIYKIFSFFPYLRLIPTPFSYLKDLHDLITSISSSIKKEDSQSAGLNDNFLSFSLNKRIEKTYPMSDARDIEKRLIGIVDKINRTKFHRVRFILIFDELDKLESSFSDKQEDLIKSDSFSPDTIRKRREAVYTLLSGLKYLLTTMKAKFIFVAGRELYEAFRADASDRSHYMSSIFNDVIVVPSFMTDTPETKRHDIFCMTEQYVCRSLMSDSYNTNEHYLDNYKRFLEKVLDFNSHNEKKLVIQKTLIVLYNFIVYLTYASKGAPKKMVNLLERHIINKEQMQNECDVDSSDRHIIVETGNSSFYLRFDYYDMYMFALMSRIVLPVVYRFDRGKKHKYGDKLLVTSMFFLDHLYKFHRNSFSWRALEASPEIIDVNKVPELREHINDILHYISQNDLKNISNGLYDFRFYKKIAQEISFLTRVSETASAFFNFTLDETYSVKQYYQRKLEKIRKEYDSDKIPVKNTVEELASIHFTLGELYLYEEEIADAVVEFDMAVSILYTIEPTEMTSEHIVLLMKSMLSIGIAYEKQNQNDRALLIYIECVKFLIASKNTNINDFGLETEECASGKMIVYPSSTAWNREEPRLYFNKIHRCEEMSLIKAVDDVKHMHPTIHRFLSKIAAFDTLRLLYLPILAKLQILEKVQTCGLQLMDLQRCVKEFSYLANMMNKENKNILISNFFLKVGDILYYKNSRFLSNEEFFNCLFRNYFVEKDCCNFQKEDLPECSDCPNNNRCNNSCPDRNDAYHFYAFALRILLYGTTQRYYTMSLSETIEHLKSERDNGYKNWDESKFLLLATILTNLGDTILALIREKEESTEKDRNELFIFLRDFVNNRNNKQKESIINLLSEMFNGECGNEYKNNELIEVLSYYILAYMYFKKGTSNNMASFQCYRILLVFKYNIPHINSTSQKDELEDIARYFTESFINEKGVSFKEMHFEDKNNWMRIFDKKNLFDYNSEKILNSRNILYDESLEGILTYLGIKLNTITDTLYIERFQEMFKTLRYDNIGSILNRIKWLKFVSEVNLKEIQIMLNTNTSNPCFKQYMLIENKIETIDKTLDYENDRKKVCELLQDSINKLYEAISLVKLYGENFALTNYYVADIYHRMRCLLKWKMILIRKWPELKDCCKKVGDIYDTEIYESISKANVNRYFYKAKEMHDQGRTYKDMINRSCFLNDEFSDQRFHFITAHERWSILDKDFGDFLKTEANSHVCGDYSLQELFAENEFIPDFRKK